MLSLFIALQNFVSDSADRLKNESKGATAVEYGLLVGLIAVAIIATLLLLGPELNGLFEKVEAGLTKANTAGTTTTTTG